MRDKQKQLERSRKYEAEHRIARRLKNKRWVANNKLYLRDYKWKQALKKYGISTEQYNEMFLKQAGNCAICGVNQSKFTKRLYVDHDHKTGNVRGILCVNCNMLIGHAMEDVGILVKSINYLKKWNIHQKK